MAWHRLAAPASRHDQAQSVREPHSASPCQPRFRSGTAAHSQAVLRSGRASKTRPVLRLDLWPGPAYFTPMSSALHELERRVRRFEPCLPRPAKKPPTGPGWIHEIKHDGFRIVAHRDTDRVRLVTRNGFELAFRMGNVLVFAFVGALFALTPLATFAQSPPGPAGPVTASPRSGWSIIEDKPATGKSAQFSAGIK